MSDAIRIGMPLAEFLELSAQQPFELINGKRRPIVPTVYRHSKAIQFLLFRLRDYTQVHGGNVFSETTFILPTADKSHWVEGSRIPDVMLFLDNRIAEYEASDPEYLDTPLALIPDLVIEVVSPTDKLIEVAEKIDAYLADGVRLIWQVDAYTRKVIVFSPDAEQPRYLRMGDVLDGADILPDFRLPLAELFAAVG